MNRDSLIRCQVSLANSAHKNITSLCSWLVISKSAIVQEIRSNAQDFVQFYILFPLFLLGLHISKTGAYTQEKPHAEAKISEF